MNNKSDSCKISIVVPVYSVESYLQKCVNSILAQSYNNIENILIDDGSPDGCSQICDEFCINDSRVIVIHQKNAGVSIARNKGLDAASGKYISFVDSDDWIEDDMYEVLYNMITASKSNIAFSYSCIGDRKPKKISADKIKIYSPKEAIKKLLTNQHDLTAICSKLYERDVISTLRFSPKIAMAEDALFITNAIINSTSVSYINYQSYHYTIRADSATHTFKENYITILDSVDKILNIINDFDCEIGKIAKAHIPEFDLFVSKEAEKHQMLTKRAYGKIIFHIKNNLNLDSWKILTLKKKFWLLLLLLGRTPYIIGRKLFR